MNDCLNVKSIVRTKNIDPYYLSDDHAVIIGEELAHPFKVKRLVGQSGMSYGSLGGQRLLHYLRTCTCWLMDEYRRRRII